MLRKRHPRNEIRRFSLKRANKNNISRKCRFREYEGSHEPAVPTSSFFFFFRDFLFHAIFHRSARFVCRCKQTSGNQLLLIRKSKLKMQIKARGVWNRDQVIPGLRARFENVSNFPILFPFHSEKHRVNRFRAT